MLSENTTITVTKVGSHHNKFVSEACVIGVDLGGTNVRAQAIYASGDAAGDYRKNPSLAQQGTDAIVDAVTNTVREAIQEAKGEVKAIGLAVPGHIDDAEGLVRWAPNFGREVDGVFLSWRDVPLKKMLQDKLDLPVYMGNDANMAAIGEYRYGTGRNSASCLVLITVGTGIGGGVVMAPKSVMGQASGPLLLIGGNAGGAELGHMIVQHGGLDATAGSYGSLEAYCQRDAIVKRAQYRLQRGRSSKIWDLVEGNLGRITPQIIAEAARQNDEVGVEVFTEVGTYMGVGVGSFINIFAPDIVAIGGQIAKAGDTFMDAIKSAARNVAIPSLFHDCEIVTAELLDDAGIKGAAALAFQNIGA